MYLHWFCYIFTTSVVVCVSGCVWEKHSNTSLRSHVIVLSHFFHSYFMNDLVKISIFLYRVLISPTNFFWLFPGLQRNLDILNFWQIEQWILFDSIICLRIVLTYQEWLTPEWPEWCSACFPFFPSVVMINIIYNSMQYICISTVLLCSSILCLYLYRSLINHQKCDFKKFWK